VATTLYQVRVTVANEQEEPMIPQSKVLATHMKELRFAHVQDLGRARSVDFLDRLLWVSFIFSLGFEFAPFFGTLSTFKVVTFPLAIIGLVLLMRRVPTAAEFLTMGWSLLPIVGYLPMLQIGPSEGLPNLVLGLVPFLPYVSLYLRRNGSDGLTVWAIALLGAPAVLAYTADRLGYNVNAYHLANTYRFVGFCGDPNFQGVYLACGIMACIVAIIHPTSEGNGIEEHSNLKGVRQRSESSPLLLKVVVGLVIAAYSYLLILTSSRGAVLSVAIGLVVITILYTKHWAFYIVAFAAIVALSLPTLLELTLVARLDGGSALDALLARNQALLNQQFGGEADDRIHTWRYSLWCIQEAGFFQGYTLDRFVAEMNYWPHNSYADVALEGGIFGLLVFFVWIGNALRALPFNKRALGLSAAGLLVQVMIVGAGFFLLSATQMKIFWFVMCFAATAPHWLRVTVEPAARKKTSSHLHIANVAIATS
jgi:hypothetical protein